MLYRKSELRSRISLMWLKKTDDPSLRKKVKPEGPVHGHPSTACPLTISLCMKLLQQTVSSSVKVLLLIRSSILGASLCAAAVEDSARSLGYATLFASSNNASNQGRFSYIKSWNM
ncbi:hypothetical protein L1987_23764 [Smallanthus sonchifolius]|uniref:Uncharacterized protein n=1 Tax=Smallanthus sonchifolius TaxID=185202 RepID=A0ACB9IIS7_9ASTR|nr:hypothetical protein L1987_23764 [Smallanthus sonchifolius]